MASEAGEEGEKGLGGRGCGPEGESCQGDLTPRSGVASELNQLSEGDDKRPERLLKLPVLSGSS